MSEKVKAFVDPTPLGKGYLVREKQTFLARGAELPADIVAAVVARTREFEVIQGWLASVYGAASRRGAVIEVPDAIREILCPDQISAAKRSEPVSEAPSRKKSPTQQRKTKSSSTTSPETE